MKNIGIGIGTVYCLLEHITIGPSSAKVAIIFGIIFVSSVIHFSPRRSCPMGSEILVTKIGCTMMEKNCWNHLMIEDKFIFLPSPYWFSFCWASKNLKNQIKMVKYSGWIFNYVLKLSGVLPQLSFWIELFLVAFLGGWGSVHKYYLVNQLSFTVVIKYIITDFRWYQLN